MRVAVADTGPGIAPEHLPHVCGRFWKTQGGNRHGAGLGLAICKGIVEAHGGSIGVESVLAGGSTFAFALPAAETGPTAAARAPPGSGSTLRSVYMAPQPCGAGFFWGSGCAQPPETRIRPRGGWAGAGIEDMGLLRNAGGRPRAAASVKFWSNPRSGTR